MTRILRRTVGMMIAAQVCVCVLVVSSAKASADDRISIAQGSCEEGVHLVARGARLTDVLQQLAKVLDFQLQVTGRSDSVVDVDVSAQPAELISKLSAVDSVVVSQARDPHCRGRFRVAKVWLLSKASADLQPPTATAAAHREMSQEEKQQVREGDNAYRKAHGMPPLAD